MRNECSGLEVKEHSILGCQKKFSMATWGHNGKRFTGNFVPELGCDAKGKGKPFNYFKQESDSFY